jgi:hypothetical protein
MTDLPLQRTWSLWYDTIWTDLKLLGSFNSIVCYWQIFNRIDKVTAMKHKTNLRLFEKDIHPSREDKQNEHGGQWILQYYRDVNINNIWLNLTLDLIGETLTAFDIVGIELNVRDRGHRLSLWTKTYAKNLGEYLNLHCGASVVSIVYKKHEDIAKNISSFAVTPVFVIPKKLGSNNKKT